MQAGARFLLWLLIFSGLSTPATALDDAELQELSEIAQRGAPGLALQLLDRMQASATGYSDSLLLERQRIELLKLAGDWAAVVARLKLFPLSGRGAAGSWANTELARAYLQSGEPRQARKVLRELLWHESTRSESVQSGLRRLIISSYVQEGRNDDAFRAISRYSRDYGGDHAVLLLLRARVLLQSRRHEEAVWVLDNIDGREAQLLRMTARLRSQSGEVRPILAQAMALASRQDLDRSLHQEAWALVAEAALAAGNRPGRILALERIFGNEVLVPSLVSIFDLRVGRYWEACLEYGREMANRDRLLLGQDEVWLETIERDAVATPVRARALAALLIEQSVNQKRVDQAAVLFGDLLRGGPGGAQLLLRLFAETGRLPNGAPVPPGLRQTLTDLAVEAGDIALAARLSTEGLSDTSGEADSFAHRLRKNRLLLLGGEHQRAFTGLQRMLNADEPLAEEQAAALLQVLFDVQALGGHHEALGLLRKLLQRVSGDQLSREIYYWIGDSYKALRDHPAAARAYLKSAGLNDPYSMDQWAQTARYQAAEQLALSGLHADARAVYRNLLHVTRDVTRRAVLQNRIQRLHTISEGKS